MHMRIVLTDHLPYDATWPRLDLANESTLTTPNQRFQLLPT